jgi:hypothetical protein
MERGGKVNGAWTSKLRGAFAQHSPDIDSGSLKSWHGKGWVVFDMLDECPSYFFSRYCLAL